MATLRWPTGRSIDEFEKSISHHFEDILMGSVIALDPASRNAGWAYFKGGKLKTSGVISVNQKGIHTRLRALAEELSNLPTPDLLLIEQIRGSHAHDFLKYSIGVSMVAIRSPEIVFVPISIWKAYSLLDATYEKSDEADAIKIGEATIAYTQEKTI